MGPPILDDLKKVLVDNNRYSGWCTFAVFAGLIVEYTVLLFPKWKELKLWEKAFTVLAGIAIAGGVWGEYHFGSKASDAAISIEAISERRIADTNALAQAASVQAAGFQKEAAQLQGEAAEAQREAEKERLARVKLEREIQPRAIFSVHKRDLEAARLKAFAPSFDGRKIAIDSLADPEAMVFAVDILDVLGRAGIKANGALIGSMLSPRAPRFGVEITGPSGDEGFIKALMYSVCVDADTLCRGEWGPKYNDLKIEVDFKPIPDIVIRSKK